MREKKESENLEFRKSLSELNEGVISLSSMLNKHHGGVVIFGINDEGRICGLTAGKNTTSDIRSAIQNDLKPFPLEVNIEDYEEDGKSLIKVSVSGDDTPYSAYGRYYIRVDDSDILMDSYQLQMFLENKDESYLKWERTAAGHTVDEIDENLLIDCIRTANEKGRLNYVYRNAKEALQKLDLLTDDGNLNNAGWYLFGNGKPLTIKEANYPTDSRTQFGEIKEFQGNIFECMNEALSYIQNHITYKAEIVGAQREETPEIPVRAIREIVINSFAHCSYARVGDFNQYVIYRSSVSIYNPGSVIRGIDPVKFASGQVGSKIRNVLIASTLYKYGFIDAFGTGFDRTFTLCAKAGVEYKYREDEFGFTFMNQDFLNDQKHHAVNDTPDRRENDLDLRILEAIRKNKYITIAELAEVTGKSKPTVYRHMESLSESGKVKRVGSRKTGYWDLKEQKILK